MRHAAWLIALVLLALPAGEALAASAFEPTSTPGELRRAYREARRGDDKFKILIVPGHDDQYWGTSYGGLREADLNVALAGQIAELLKEDKRLEVRLARTSDGYDEELAEFFMERREYVENFLTKHKSRMLRHLESGKVEPASGVDHATAPTEAAYRLYAINKWASDQKYHIVLHIHFNDTARYSAKNPGPYTGFTIYVPESQFGNARGSRAVGEALKDKLLGVHYLSTLPGESEGVVEDQELIAIGAYNTAKPASVLVEYAYIYEQRIQNPLARQGTLAAMAKATYEGLEEFLND